MNEPSIQITGLSFGYRGKLVIDQLNWSLGPGTIGLLGPNGAGKSTLIKCLVGLADPKSGDITVKDGTRFDIGYVPQNAALPGLMRVQAAIEYAAWLHGVPSRELATKAQQVMDALDLGSFAKRRIRNLSGGERQRVAVASAIAHEPRILVLDEPTVGLDPSQRLAVRRAITALPGLECTLIATHLIEDVEHLCSDVAVMNHGGLVYSGSVAELLARAQQQPSAAAPGSAFELAYESLIEGGTK